MYGRTVTYVIAHMGGVSFFEPCVGGGYVDISGALLTIAQLFEPTAMTRFFRTIGIDRLLFATDFPVYPYEGYYDVLDAMDLTDDEVGRIAHGNAERMLAGLPPVEAAEDSASGVAFGRAGA